MRTGRKPASLDCMSAKTSSSDPDAEALAEAVAEEVRAERIDSLRGPDSPEGRAIGRVVGENVAQHRNERRLSLETVAERSGIRVDLLEKLEGGKAVPSLRAIWHLATALEVPFGSLLANTVLAEASDPDFRVQTADRGVVIVDANGHFRSRMLFLQGDPRTPEVYELTLDAGCFEPAGAHARDTYEHISVISGNLIIRAGDSESRLGKGDTIFFRADMPHSYENPGPEPAIAHLVMAYAGGKTDD